MTAPLPGVPWRGVSVRVFALMLAPVLIVGAGSASGPALPYDPAGCVTWAEKVVVEKGVRFTLGAAAFRTPPEVRRRGSCARCGRGPVVAAGEGRRHPNRHRPSGPWSGLVPTPVRSHARVLCVPIRLVRKRRSLDCLDLMSRPARDFVTHGGDAMSRGAARLAKSCLSSMFGGISGISYEVSFDYHLQFWKVLDGSQFGKGGGLDTPLAQKSASPTTRARLVTPDSVPSDSSPPDSSWRESPLHSSGDHPPAATPPVRVGRRIGRPASAPVASPSRIAKRPLTSTCTVPSECCRGSS